MSRWQLSALRPSRSLQLKLACVVLIAHLVLMLFGLSIGKKREGLAFRFSRFDRSRIKRVVLVPLKKRVHAKGQMRSTAGQQSDVGKKIKKKKNVVIKSVKKKKLVSKKALPKKKLTKKSKKIASKKVKQKKVVNKLVKAKEPKAVKKTKKLEITSDKSKIAKSESPAVVKDEQVLLVGRHEMQELRVFEHLNSQVKSHWKPPIGIRQGLECTLFIDLDKQGNVIKIDVDRASGVRAFDTSARKAAKKMRYPRVLWGSRVPPLIFNS